MTENRIGYLAAMALIRKCNYACHKLAKSLNGMKLGGEETFVYNKVNAWGDLTSLVASIDVNEKEDNPHEKPITIAKLATDTLRHSINQALENMVLDTKDVCFELPDGAAFWNQYSEGLVTESEYMNKLIDELSRYEPKAE